MNVILRNYLTTSGICLRGFFIFLLQNKFWLCILVNKLSQNFKVLTAPILTADSYFINLKLLCLHNKDPLS